ncbi:MAG TPA: hypothetical protein VNS09_03290 [Solirubrobacter sp.]|nr:hypothetical protein [Solirubrobacter sp.]
MHPALMTMIADERAKALRRGSRGRVVHSRRFLGRFTRRGPGAERRHARAAHA